MARLRRNSMKGTITDNPLSDSATTINSAAFASLPVVSSPDVLVLVLDPQGVNGDPEIVWVTAHTAAATSVTVSRHQEGTSARSHISGTVWNHSPTLLDFPLVKAGTTMADSDWPYTPVDGCEGTTLGNGYKWLRVSGAWQSVETAT